MQWKSTWLLLALFVVGIMSLSIVGCGSDDTGTPGEPAVTTPSTDTPVEVASITPIDYDAEKELKFRQFIENFIELSMRMIRPTLRIPGMAATSLNSLLLGRQAVQLNRFTQ